MLIVIIRLLQKINITPAVLVITIIVKLFSNLPTLLPG